MTPHELDKTRRRLAGGTIPNASGATQQEREAPAILAGSEPSRELVPPKLTPEEEAIAAANRAARAKLEAGEDPVNGEVDPMDAVHEAAIWETAALADEAQSKQQDSTDSLLD
jgi:hypothetical protein